MTKSATWEVRAITNLKYVRSEVWSSPANRNVGLSNITEVKKGTELSGFSIYASIQWSPTSIIDDIDGTQNNSTEASAKSTVFGILTFNIAGRVADILPGLTERKSISNYATFDLR